MLSLGAQNHVHEHPGHQGDGCTHVGVDDRGRGVRPGEVRVTTVEAVPAKPQDSGADGNEHQGGRYRPLTVAGQARTDDGGGDKPGGASGEVDDVSTTEVQRALARPVATAPEHEG